MKSSCLAQAESRKLALCRFIPNSKDTVSLIKNQRQMAKMNCGVNELLVKWEFPPFLLTEMLPLPMFQRATFLRLLMFRRSTFLRLLPIHGRLHGADLAGPR
jgi:hypothetical protein